MISKPVITVLPKELQDIKEKWLLAERREQDIIYARDFAPRFVPLFAELPLHGWKGGLPRFKALISVLGFSWQPVALMAAWVNPEKWLILGSEESQESKIGDEAVIDLVSRLSGLTASRITFVKVSDPLETGIYHEIRSFIKKYNFKPGETAVDPTGGKKSMSASAALAGFLTGAWLLYVDYGEYAAKNRIPVAGTEYPRLLQNPLEVFGDRELEHIKQAFRNGNYEEAAHLAESLSARLYEPREAQAWKLFAETYGAWHRFDFETACEKMEELKRHLDVFIAMGDWSWARDVLMKIERQYSIIKKLCVLTEKIQLKDKFINLRDGLPLILNHLASADRTLQHNQISTTMLLIYASLERYFDFCLWANHGLDDENPDYSRLELDLNKFHEAGKKLHGNKYERREPFGQISFALGAQLLATLKPELLSINELGPLKGIMNDRNKCEFEHGVCARILERNQVEKYLRKAREIIKTGFKINETEFNDALEAYAFPAV